MSLGLFVVAFASYKTITVFSKHDMIAHHITYHLIWLQSDHHDDSSLHQDELIHEEDDTNKLPQTSNVSPTLNHQNNILTKLYPVYLPQLLVNHDQEFFQNQNQINF